MQGRPTTDQELIEFENIEDVFARPAYSFNIDPSTTKLVRIIGVYTLREPTPCGLSNCHQPHQDGYLIETADGRETNIGNRCGRTHFGVTFLDERARATRVITRRRQLGAIDRLLKQRAEIEARLEKSLSGAQGATAISSRIRGLKRELPRSVSERLESMARQGNSAITRTRRRTETEMETAPILPNGRRDIYIHDVIGQVRHISAWRYYLKLQEILILNIQKRLHALEPDELEDMKPKALAELAKWAGEVETLFNEAESFRRGCFAFLQRDNLEELLKLAETTSDQRAIARAVEEYSFRASADTRETAP